jgi:hypothetical protein
MRKTILLLAIVPSALAAQSAPAIRLINAADASTKPVFGLVTSVRQLPNGSLLVNDVLKRQLTLLDASLTNPVVVADSISGGANSYGTRPGGLIPYLADSTLFVDPAGLSMFVLDGKGAIARVASVPRSQDAGAFTQGAPALDAKGRIVYGGGRGGVRINATGPRTNNGAANNGPMISFPDPPDTTAIVRIDPATRKLDTAAFIKIPKNKVNMTNVDGRMNITTELNPMPIVDDWAVLSDGSIAIVRGRDYHVDWVNVDGSTTATPKLPFDWQRLSDEDKIAVIDSAKAAMEKMRASMGNMSPERAMVEGMRGGAGAAGGPVMVMSFSTSDGGGGRGATANAAAGGPQIQFVNPSELPDYRPPFTTGAARGDLDGNLWVRTTATRAGAVAAGPVYDVINRKGEVTDRIQLPAGRSIIGFGKGGVVYMLARDEKGSWIEKTKVGPKA